MLVGEPPFAGPTAAAILTRAMTETPRPIKATRPAVTPAVEAIVARAIARVPADRFASAAEFAQALAQAADETRTTPLPTTLATPTPALAPSASSSRVTLVARVAAALVAIAVGAFAWSRYQPLDASTRRLAVLPFENLGIAADDYFADGITDEVRGKLAVLPGLQVTARASAAQVPEGGVERPRTDSAANWASSTF